MPATRSQRKANRSATSSDASLPSSAGSNRRKRTSIASDTSTATTKKARYNLRSSKSPPDGTKQITTVTPGTVNRQIHFEQPKLPWGVVDIYNKDAAHPCCRSPPTSDHEAMMQLVDQFVCKYGKTYNEFLTTNEDREHDWLGLEEVVDEGDPSVGEDSSTLSDTPDPLAMKLPNQPLLTRKMRRTLVNWLSEVAQEFKVSDSGYHLAVSILDAILAKGPTVQEYVKYYCDDFTTVSDDAYGDKFLIHRKYFQAVGCACVLIASKIEDKTPPRVENLVYISDYSFSTAKLIDLESTICEQLEFRLFLKTPVMFMDLNLRASQASEHHSCRHYRNPMLESMLKYLLELSRSSYGLSQRKPSLICAACTYLARATLGIGEYWTSTLEYYTGYNKNDLTDTIVKVHLLHMAAEKSDRFGTTPAYTKYATDKLHRVSLKTVRRLEDLGLDVFETHDESFSADSDYAIVI